MRQRLTDYETKGTWNEGLHPRDRGRFAPKPGAARAPRGPRTTAEGTHAGRIADWAQGFAVKINSSLDVWMTPKDKERLFHLVEAGGKVTSRVIDYGGGEDDRYSDALERMTRRMGSQGYILFAHEENMTQGEAVYVRRPGVAGGKR